MNLSYPDQLDRINRGLKSQEGILKGVASIYADAIESGGLVHL